MTLVPTPDSDSGYQFRVDENMYHLSVPKPFIFNLVLCFLVGAGLFLMLRALSFSPVGALLGSIQLSFAFTLVAGFSLLSKGCDHYTCNII